MQPLDFSVFADCTGLSAPFSVSADALPGLGALFSVSAECTGLSALRDASADSWAPSLCDECSREGSFVRTLASILGARDLKGLPRCCPSWLVLRTLSESKKRLVREPDRSHAGGWSRERGCPPRCASTACCSRVTQSSRESCGLKLCFRMANMGLVDNDEEGDLGDPSDSTVDPELSRSPLLDSLFSDREPLLSDRMAAFTLDPARICAVTWSLSAEAHATHASQKHGGTLGTKGRLGSSMRAGGSAHTRPDTCEQ